MEIDRSQVMFVRNLIHGLPVTSLPYVANRLRELDFRLNKRGPYPIDKDEAYYLRVAGALQTGQTYSLEYVTTNHLLPIPGQLALF